jgi:hypothetical protein
LTPFVASAQITLSTISICSSIVTWCHSWDRPYSIQCFQQLLYCYTFTKLLLVNDCFSAPLFKLWGIVIIYFPVSMQLTIRTWCEWVNFKLCWETKYLWQVSSSLLHCL